MGGTLPKSIIARLRFVTNTYAGLIEYSVLDEKLDYDLRMLSGFVDELVGYRIRQIGAHADKIVFARFLVAGAEFLLRLIVSQRPPVLFLHNVVAEITLAFLEPELGEQLLRVGFPLFSDHAGQSIPIRKISYQS